MINNNELIDQIKSYNRFLNSAKLNKAYNFALEAHQNQKREEGVPYIIHPVAVAKILTELKLDSATITTGLLHDTIEDTKVTYENVKKEFGEEVANLVEGVTKISELETKASSASKAENFRKLILATSKDIRVLLVKLADRLHNMRTIQFVKDKDKAIRKAKETMEIYAPLADRMGMNRIRDELEDLSFSVLNKPARELIIERTIAGLKSARARGRKGGRRFQLTKSKVRFAQIAMQNRETKIADLCQELGGITKQTLYRYVSPTGGLREYGKKILEE